MRLFRNMHLRVSAKVILLFLLVVLFQGGTSLLFVTYIISQSSTQSFNDQMERTAQSVEAFIDDAVRDATVKTNLLAGQLKVIDYTYYGLDNMLRQEMTLFRQPLKLDAACIFGTDRKLVAVSGDPGIGDLAAKNNVVKHYFDGNPVFVLSFDRWIYLWVVCPVLRDKEVIGYLASAVKLDRSFVSGIEDTTGAGIMISWKNAVFAPSSLLDSTVLEILEKYYGKDFANPRAVQGRAGNYIYHVVTSQRLHGLYAYCFLDTTRTREVLARYNTFSFVFLIVVVVVAFVVATLFYRLTFLRPMQAFMTGVQKIAAGDLRYVIDHRTEDEFGELAQAFERMTLSLRQREREIAELGSYNSLILSSVSTGILVINLDEQVTNCNPAAREFLGIAPGTIPEHASLADLAIPEEFGVLLRESLEGHRYVHLGEARMRTAQDEPRILTVSTSPFVAQSGERIGIIAVFSDITRERKLEEQLEISSRLAAMGEMVAGVAHQIRNPLAVMKVSAEMLRDSYRPAENPDGYAKLTRMVVNEIDSLGIVVTNFLDFARPLLIHREQVRVEDAISRAVSFLPLDKFPDNDVQFRFSDNLEDYSLDRNLFEQALTNLVMNALEASPPGKPVLVSAWMEDTRLVVEVRDFGPGIDEETRKWLFTPFHTTKNQGTGLGLAIVHRIVAGHGGSVEFSSAPGEGTTFRMLL